MSVLELLGASWSQLLAVVVAALAIYAVVVLATRTLGLRSFAKMSSFDFAVTVAIGSIVAATATGSASLASGALATVVLYAAQGTIAHLRFRTRVANSLDNSPVLLMEGSEMLTDNLRMTGVTEQDVIAKLREANVLRLDQIQFVVLEATGDVSVLHADHAGASVDDMILRGVRR